MGQKIFTVNKYDFYECTSSFQKSIRQGNEEGAIFFAVELFNSGYDGYLWDRMKIILSEDIGLAEPNLPANFAALEKFYNDHKAKKKEQKPECMFLTHAVLLLVRAKKSRLIDWTLINAWRSHDTNLLPIPDDALDQHTARGKKMGRGTDHFFNIGTKLNNHFLQPGEDEAKQLAYKLVSEKPGAITFTKVGRQHQNVDYNTDDEQGDLFNI